MGAIEMTAKTQAQRFDEATLKLVTFDLGKDILDVLSPLDLEGDPEYHEAVEFSKTIEPRKDVDYSWVRDHAKDLYDRLAKVNDRIDDKANDIIKYLGGGTGLVTLAAILKIEPSGARILALALPSFVTALVSVFFAIKIRQPMPIDLPPPVKDAFDYAGAFESSAEDYFLGQWHLICRNFVAVIRLKSRRLRYATWCFFGAIFLLIVPILGAIL